MNIKVAAKKWVGTIMHVIAEQNLTRYSFIRDEVVKQHGGKQADAQVARALKELERDSLVKRVASVGDDNHKRTDYTLTPKGRKLLGYVAKIEAL